MIQRRTFAKLGAAAAASMAFGVWAADSTAPKKRAIKKGIMYGTVGVPGSILDKFKAVKTAGFEGIEPMSDLPQAEVLAARDATGLQCPSVCCATHWSQPLSSPSADVREKGRQGLERALQDAKAYGASSVLFVPAVVKKEISYADAYSRSQAEIRKVIPLAEKLQVKIAIENVWNKFLLSPLEAVRYVDEFQSPWVGWHFDVGNIIKDGWPEQWIALLGKRIQKLHIKEFSRKKMDEKGPYAGFDVDLMSGDDEWPAVMQALDAIGYDGWGIAEQTGSNTPEGLAKISAAMDKIFAM